MVSKESFKRIKKRIKESGSTRTRIQGNEWTLYERDGEIFAHPGRRTTSNIKKYKYNNGWTVRVAPNEVGISSMSYLNYGSNQAEEREVQELVHQIKNNDYEFGFIKERIFNSPIFLDWAKVGHDPLWVRLNLKGQMIEASVNPKIGFTPLGIVYKKTKPIGYSRTGPTV